jgi:hypothetical protein
MTNKVIIPQLSCKYIDDKQELTLKQAENVIDNLLEVIKPYQLINIINSNKKENKDNNPLILKDLEINDNKINKKYYNIKYGIEDLNENISKKNNKMFKLNNELKNNINEESNKNSILRVSKLHKLLYSCQKEIMGLKNVVKNAENTIKDLN